MPNKNTHKIQDDIAHLTTEIETKYPDIYKTLQETPLSLHGSTKEDDINIELEEYLETLKELIKKAESNHTSPNEFDCMLG